MSIINLTSENFDNEINDARVPVLIDFWATWCGPCKMMGPVVDQMAKEMGQNARICKVNIDEQKELATKFKIMSIPTFVLLKNGEEIGRKVGAMQKEELSKLFNI